LSLEGLAGLFAKLELLATGTTTGTTAMAEEEFDLAGAMAEEEVVLAGAMAEEEGDLAGSSETDGFFSAAMRLDMLEVEGDDDEADNLIWLVVLSFVDGGRHFPSNPLDF